MQLRCPEGEIQGCIEQHPTVSAIICAIDVHVYVFIVRFFAAPLVRSAAAKYLCATGRIEGERK